MAAMHSAACFMNHDQDAKPISITKLPLLSTVLETKKLARWSNPFESRLQRSGISESDAGRGNVDGIHV
jgi:hypothetical protein